MHLSNKQSCDRNMLNHSMKTSNSILDLEQIQSFEALSAIELHIYIYIYIYISNCIQIIVC